MDMKHSTKFTIYGTELDYNDVEKLWMAVQSAGSACTITIDQTKYNEGPYGTSITTYIDVEA